VLELDQLPRPHPDVATLTVDNETVIVLPNGETQVLNAQGSRVWALCGSGRSLSEIVQALAAEYQADPQQVRPDVVAFVQALLDDGALLPTDSPEE
jgi:hypothetical protein